MIRIFTVLILLCSLASASHPAFAGTVVYFFSDPTINLDKTKAREIRVPLSKEHSIRLIDAGHLGSINPNTAAKSLKKDDIVAGIVLHYHGEEEALALMPNLPIGLNAPSAALYMAAVLAAFLPMNRIAPEFSVHLWSCHTGGEASRGNVNFQDGFSAELLKALQNRGAPVRRIRSFAFVNATNGFVHSMENFPEIPKFNHPLHNLRLLRPRLIRSFFENLDERSQAHMGSPLRRAIRWEIMPLMSPRFLATLTALGGLSYAASGDNVAHYLATFIPLTMAVWAYGVYNDFAASGVVRVVETDQAGTRVEAVGPVRKLFRAFYRRVAESCSETLRPPAR